IHGALSAGALCTTFTASQGLLLMIPDMYKIAGELTPVVLHVAARSLATQALSIFGDHSDVMAARQTGFAMLAAGSVQEAHDFALVAHAATLEARVPFLHFFDGFRTSHEVAKIVPLDEADMRALVKDDLVHAHRARALSPSHPVIRGTAQNPDVFFQAREAGNPYYANCPAIVESAFERLGARTGRNYRLFDYVGAKDAERVLVLMGSGAETAHETALELCARGEKIGVLKVRLFRPFAAQRFVDALPSTVHSIAVLDRTKEPGAAGEPLHQDVLTAIMESWNAGTSRFAAMPKIVGGRYGLASKEFTPGMVKAVFDELKKSAPRNHFTVGITDDVTHNSLTWDAGFSTEDPDAVRALFFGLGADGTVGANKNSIKIIGERTPLEAQGYFVYDSKKSGSMTVSHLRFGRRPIRSSYLIRDASFVACHQFGLLERLSVLEFAQPGAVFLLNAPFGPDDIWRHLPRLVQEQIIRKRLKFHVVDAAGVAQAAGMGGRINSVMQTCFFALSGVLPRDEAVAAIKEAIRHSYGKRGEAVVAMNFAAVDAALAALHEVSVPASLNGAAPEPVAQSNASEFVRRVTMPLLAGNGNELPVSALPADGTWPTGTAKWERRAIATSIPAWDEALCIQCGKCVLVCPHAVMRAKVVEPAALVGAPQGFQSAPARWKAFAKQSYTIQVAPDDCTGCELCVEVCPVTDKKDPTRKALVMEPATTRRVRARADWEWFLGLPDPSRDGLRRTQVKDVQLLQPLFEFPGACAGCGETPYLRLLSQLFGDRMIVANATGCSSIFGGNLPTTPWTVNAAGRGPAWANSLFEDNAEFGLGMRVALDQQRVAARALLERLRPMVGDARADAILAADQASEPLIRAQQGRVDELCATLAGTDDPLARDLIALADALVETQLWIVGGDGWAYDIGYGGLDHVLASGRDVNILVLDTEVYSNTGGQASKSTPRGAVARFAAAGKPAAKKDLALAAMNYGNVYVAQVALGADDAQVLKALEEAAAWKGPSLVIAYSACIEHGYDLEHGLDHQQAAVKSGYWPLFRFQPAKDDGDRGRLVLDSKPPTVPLAQFTAEEGRYSNLARTNPDAARTLAGLAQHDVDERWRRYARLAEVAGDTATAVAPPVAPASGNGTGKAPAGA
ncbi:MAG: pyruvate:ferredoxin (flavodoxin) oxidoreductase, partial [Gemmatimonadales bacterium]